MLAESKRGDRLRDVEPIGGGDDYKIQGLNSQQFVQIADHAHRRQCLLCVLDLARDNADDAHSRVRNQCSVKDTPCETKPDESNAAGHELTLPKSADADL
jgi:hypothetical protein